MSTGAECSFDEVTPGVWQYTLQRPPYGDMDGSDTFGPFDTYKLAHEHLNENHANPGGSWFGVHDDHVHVYADVSYKGAWDGYKPGESWTQYECVGCGQDTPEAQQEARDAQRLQDIARTEERLVVLKAEAAAAITAREQAAGRG